MLIQATSARKKVTKLERRNKNSICNSLNHSKTAKNETKFYNNSLNHSRAAKNEAHKHGLRGSLRTCLKHSQQKAEITPSLISVGSRVEAKWKALDGGQRWYKGRIKAAKPDDGRFSVVYDDGYTEDQIQLCNLRLLSP
jgi:hypothetical protein